MANLEPFHNLIYYNLLTGASLLSLDNSVEIFTEGMEFYYSLKEDLKNASEYIHIISYIIKPDEVLENLEAVLAEKSGQGVTVRLLVDAFGSRRINREIRRRLTKKGIELRVFYSGGVNLRNHRKIIVVDGKIGYVGGFNFAREYLGKDKKIGDWRDTHLKLKGAAVQGLDRWFVRDWNRMVSEKLPIPCENLWEEKNRSADGAMVQIIASGPDCKWQNIRNNYIRLFQLAKRYIYIQTPYFVPDEPTLHALKMAALSGVDVRLMLPCKPDHVFVYWASCSYAAGLLDAGIRCYTYDKGFLHAKGVTVDGKVCCYGTANMDIRSFRLNYEVNAMIYHEATAEAMEEIFIKDLEFCTEITKETYDQRGKYIRMKEKVARYFSSVL